MKQTFLALSALTLLFVACKKNDNNNTTLPAKDRLTGAWIKTSQKTTTTIGTGRPEVVDNMPTTCVKYYLYRYAADGKLTAEESDNLSERCDPNNPKVLRTATWQLLSNDTRLVTFGSSFQTIDTFYIEQLTSNAMRLSKTDVGFVGSDSIKRVYEYTYSKK